MAEKHIVYHWKQFDLHSPLAQLRQLYGDDVEITGLLSSDIALLPAERCQSFLGIPRVSGFREDFYQQCTDQLREQYRLSGTELFDNGENAANSIKELAERYGKLVIWYTPRVGMEEEEFIQGLQDNLPSGVRLEKLASNTLLQEDELPFTVEDTPRTFSKFRKKVEKVGLSTYKFSRLPVAYPVNSSPGRKRMDEFIFTSKKIVHYKETRNGLGKGDYSSRLSPWLAAGCISGAEVGSAILRFEEQQIKNESTYWLLFELLWRDFFHWLHRGIGNLLFSPEGMKRRRSPGLLGNISWQFHGSNQPMDFAEFERVEVEKYWQTFRCWAHGETGEPLVDTIMRELRSTGEISNRARQCAASYLIHDLHVPWWWGAQWFEYLLIDYDVSSNWGNWAYIAGVGADSKPVRRFNMKIQSKNYDPDGVYREWGKSDELQSASEILPAEFPGSFK